MMDRLSKIVFSVVLVLIANLSQAQSPPDTADGRPQGDMLPWRWAMQKMARPLGLQFTDEADDRVADKVSPLTDRFVTYPTTMPAGSQELVAQLAAWFPQASIVVDQSDPNLIRIRDKSLNDQSKGANPLDERVTLKIDGKLDDLINQWPAGEFYLEPNSLYGTSAPRYSFPAAIDAKNLTWRQVMTDCLSTRHTNTLLWDADIKPIKGKIVASMTFYFPANSPGGRPGQPSPSPRDRAAGSSTTTQPAGTADSPRPGMVPWLDVFEPLAFKLGVYVSIENDRRASMATMPIFDRRYVTPPATPPATRDELLKLVAAWFPSADITVAEENPSLIHLSESSLRDQSKGTNLLEEKVTFKLEDHPGVLMQKLEAISKGTIVMDSPTAKKTINDAAIQPTRKVTVTNQPYRMFVDEAVTSVNLQRVMWEADILNLDGQPGVVVKVMGALDSLIPLTRSDALNARLATRPATTRPARRTRLPATLPTGQPPGTGDGAPQIGMIFWRDAAEPLAKMFKVHFYIENDLRNTENPPMPFDARFVTPPPQNLTARSQLFILIDTAWFPGTSISTDDRRPNIYWIQPGLPSDAGRIGNPLDAPCTLRFDGSLEDLMKQLEVSTNGAIVFDKQSAKAAGPLNGGKPVHIFLMEQTYRDVFLQAIAPNEDQHFLWQADIQTINGKPTAVMKFFGNNKPAGH
jgi:hypothetical protein